MEKHPEVKSFLGSLKMPLGFKNLTVSQTAALVRPADMMPQLEKVRRKIKMAMTAVAGVGVCLLILGMVVFILIRGGRRLQNLQSTRCAT